MAAFLSTAALPTFLAEIFLPLVAFAWWLFTFTLSTAGTLISIFRYGRHNADLDWYASHPPAQAQAVNEQPAKDEEQVLQDKLGDASLPAVTILRPLKGLDCNIERNLVACLTQEYPRDKVEMIFCVADPTDPVVDLVQRLLVQFREMDAKLYIGDEKVGMNPKINNLVRGYEAAKHDIVWIVDSNVWMAPTTLKRSIEKLQQPRVGLVHHLPVGIQPRSLGSDLEMFFLNSVHARTYLGLNWAGPASCVIGKSCLFRRSDLDIKGGLRPFGKYMAEDNMIGEAIWSLGLRHAMTPDRAWQALGDHTAWDFFLRRQRWGRTRKYTLMLATLVEPFTECFAACALFAWSVRCLWAPAIALLGLDLAALPEALHAPPSFNAMYWTHIAWWFVADFVTQNNVAHSASMPFLAFTKAWLIRELTALPVYLWGIAGSTVKWRSLTYQLLPGGTVRLIEGVEEEGSDRAIVRLAADAIAAGYTADTSPAPAPPLIRPLAVTPIATLGLASGVSRAVTPDFIPHSTDPLKLLLSTSKVDNLASRKTRSKSSPLRSESPPVESPPPSLRQRSVGAAPSAIEEHQRDVQQLRPHASQSAQPKQKLAKPAVPGAAAVSAPPWAAWLPNSLLASSIQSVTSHFPTASSSRGKPVKEADEDWTPRLRSHSGSAAI